VGQAKDLSAPLYITMHGPQNVKLVNNCRENLKNQSLKKESSSNRHN